MLYFLAAVKINNFVLTDGKQESPDIALSLKISDGVQKCVEGILQNFLCIGGVTYLSGNKPAEFGCKSPVKQRKRSAVAG